MPSRFDNVRTWREPRVQAAQPADMPDKRIDQSGKRMRAISYSGDFRPDMALGFVVDRKEVIPSTVAPSRDVAFINAVVNHPEVRPFIGSPDLGELDLSPAVARPENLFLIGVHGGFALGWSAPGVREVHTFILPSGRGLWARQARTEMVAYCRRVGNTMLWTKIPPGQPHVVQFAREAGMRPTGQEIETFGVKHAVYKMELQ